MLRRHGQLLGHVLHRHVLQGAASSTDKSSRDAVLHHGLLQGVAGQDQGVGGAGESELWGQGAASGS